MDSWFTSVPLAEELVNPPIQLTIVGTLHKNKREIPLEFLEVKNRAIGTPMFCYDREKTLVTYKPKSNKLVILLSIAHETGMVNCESNKPEIIHFYNETKAGVDFLDQMCSTMSTSRKTRWPLCIFYAMLNIVLVNAYVIYCHNKLQIKEKPITRREFAKDVSESLMKPWRQHLRSTTLTHSLKVMIADILQGPLTED